MKFWVGTTDNNWFDFLARRHFDEVNFWQPSVSPPFKQAPLGMPFLFKLKRPHNHIAGGGFFVQHSAIPLSLAWEIFGLKNGAASLTELKELMGPLTQRGQVLDEIGCQIIANPVFLPPEHWLPEPPGWSSNIVRGKGYDSQEQSGLKIWSHIEQYLVSANPAISSSDNSIAALSVQEPLAKFGSPVMVAPRLGQGAFRLAVTEAYRKRCAFTGENTLLALEAAHIVPYADEGTHDIKNGLLLRADFHRLFDVGLVSVTPDLKIRISPRIREAWFNGKAYYRLDNQPLAIVPEETGSRPDPDRLNWHQKNRFQA